MFCTSDADWFDVNNQQNLLEFSFMHHSINQILLTLFVQAVLLMSGRLPILMKDPVQSHWSEWEDSHWETVCKFDSICL